MSFLFFILQKCEILLKNTFSTWKKYIISFFSHFLFQKIKKICHPKTNHLLYHEIKLATSSYNWQTSIAIANNQM